MRNSTDNDNDWIVVTKNKKNSFDPNRLKLNSSSKKVTLEKVYNKTNKSFEEIE